MTQEIKNRSSVAFILKSIAGFQNGRLTEVTFQGDMAIQGKIIVIAIIGFIKISPSEKGEVQCGFCAQEP